MVPKRVDVTSPRADRARDHDAAAAEDLQDAQDREQVEQDAPHDGRPGGRLQNHAVGDGSRGDDACAGGLSEYLDDGALCCVSITKYMCLYYASEGKGYQP